MWPKSLSQMLGWIYLICCLGCSQSPPPLRAPRIDSAAPTAAITEYDANNNGMIDGNELNKVPSLKASLKRVDKDGDGKVSADEISERIKLWQHSGLAFTGVTTTVRQNGQPVAGAEVQFQPEKFLGPNLKPARGTTNQNGQCNIKISSDPDERGVHLGYYRVQISKKGGDGKETIPPRYNTETELGVEVSPDNASLDHLVFNLTGP